MGIVVDRWNGFFSSSIFFTCLSANYYSMAHEYLVQRLAVAVQQGNAVSIMGTMGDPGQDFFG